MKILSYCFLIALGVSQQRITLDEAIKYGIENNIQEKIGKLDISFFDEQILQGYLNFAPSLTFNTSYVTVSDFSLQQQKAQVDGFKALLEQFGLGDFADDIPNTAFKNVHRSNLNLKWNLFAKGEALKRLSEIKNQKQIQELTNTETNLDIVYQIRESFYDLYIADQFKSITKLRLDNVKNRVDQVEKLVEKGFRNEAELLRWKLEQSKAEEAHFGAEIRHQNAEKQFALTIGAPLSTIYIASLETDLEENIFTDINEDMIQNIDIDRLLEIQKIQKQKQIAIDNQFYTYGRFLPSVDLTYTKTWQQSNTFLPAQQPWEISLNFSWELFSSFRDYLEVEKNEISTRRGELLKMDAKRQIEVSIQKLYLGLDQSRKQLKTSKYAIELAKESYRIQKNRYEKGLSTNLDLLDSEVQLYQANLDALQTYKSYILSGYSIKKLLGQIN